VVASDRGAVLVALGLAVRRLRTERGMTQEALAEASGLHPRYVSDIERGRRNVGIVNLDRLAVALGVRLDELTATVEDERRSSR
jgi:XRE family aerobic/anaerobic benzoate catabolism transcriptional regulator